jgi:hypothetical protein
VAKIGLQLPRWFRVERELSHSRWHNVLDLSVDRVNGRRGRWIETEDMKLMEAVQKHGGKNWDAVAALVVPGRL